MSNDYHFQLAKNDLLVDVDGSVELGGKTVVSEDPLMEVPNEAHKELEQYEYSMGSIEPFSHPDQRLTEVRREGQLRTILKAQQIESEHWKVYGSSQCRMFNPGFVIHRAGQAATDDPKAGYLLTRLRHGLKPVAATDAPDGQPGLSYSNEFSCQPAEVIFRAPRRAPKPIVPGRSDGAGCRPRRRGDPRRSVRPRQSPLSLGSCR